MTPAKFALPFAATLILFGGSAMAQDVIFDNAIDPAIAEQLLAEPAADALFAEWQTALALHETAVTSGADAAAIAALQTAAETAAQAYEAELVAQNTVQLAALAPVLLDDDMFAALIAPAAPRSAGRVPIPRPDWN